MEVATEEEDDFMTVFFRNCERIVLENATTIHEMLEERREDAADDWTSIGATEPSSSTNTVEQRRRLSDNDDEVLFFNSLLRFGGKTRGRRGGDGLQGRAA